MPASDILACPVDQVLEIVTDEEGYEKGNWFMAKNIGMIELSQLGQMLGVAEYESLMGGFELVGEPLPEGPWPQTLPPALADSLTFISDDQIADVCGRWSGIEEFSGMMPAESLVEYLTNLREFLSAHEGPYFLVNAL